MKNAKRLTKCSWCGAEIWRKPFNPNTKKPISHSFCDNGCKGKWQLHFQKPEGVTMAWLVQKYEVEKLDCPEIAAIVGRDAKSIWNWLQGFGIVTRPRGSSNSKQWERGDRIHPGGYPHSETTKELLRSISIADGRVPYIMPDGSHYMKGRKGDLHHSWQGGLTPERQSVCSTSEWRDAVKAVWSRADAKCERCGKDHRSVDNRKIDGFHVHHIKPFRFRKFRSDVNNLALLCRPCHHFVHSKKNVNKEFIDDGN